jgi:hypothetical protein
MSSLDEKKQPLVESIVTEGRKRLTEITAAGGGAIAFLRHG